MKYEHSNPLIRYKTVVNTFFTLILIICFFGVKASASTINHKITEITQTSASDESIELIWNAINEPNLSYLIEFSEDKEDWISIAPESTIYASLAKYSLAPAHTYYIRIRSKIDTVNTITYGDYSDIITATTAPKAVTNLRQTAATANSATISWDPSEGATFYTIYEYISEENQKIIATTSNPSYTFTKLKTGVSLANKYYVTASIQSPTFTATSVKSDMLSSLKTLPKKVTGVSMSFFNLNKDCSSYKWKKNASAAGYQITFYDLKGKKVISSTTKNTSITMGKKIKRNTFYKVNVRAYITLDGKKFYGKSSNVTYISSQPKISKIRCLRSGIKINWSKVKGATSYTIYVAPKQYKNCKDYKKYKTVKSTSTIIKRCGNSRLKNKKSYYYYVIPNITVRKTTYAHTANHYWKTIYKR